MGTGLIEFYNKRIRKEWKTAFFASLIVGLTAHLYKFMNELPNHDALYNSYSSQNMIRSGRWLLAPACIFSSYFDLPWITGLLALVFLALSVVVLIEVFELTNPVVIILTAGIMASFPAITETFFYEYTSDGYMLAMLIASCAILCAKAGSYTWKKCAVAALCICCTCAVYQAYVSYAAVLMLCYLIFIILTGDLQAGKLYRWLGMQAVAFGGGLALYFVIWKLLLKVEGASASGYEGIDSVGKVDAGVLVLAVFKTAKEFIQFFVKWDVRKYGFNFWIVLGILFLAVFVAGIVLAVIKTQLFGRISELTLLLIALAAIPFAAFMWFFTSGSVIYNVRMEQSLCLLYVLTIIIYDRFANVRTADFAALLVFVCIMTNILVANIFYRYMNLAYEKGYSTAVELSTRIHLVDDGSAKHIAVIGELPGFSYEDYKKPSLLGGLGPLYVVDHNLAANHILLPLFMSSYTDFSLAYYTLNDIEMPVYVPVDSTAPISGGWEIRFPYVSEEVQDKLEKSREVEKMPVWPDGGSVRQIEDTIIVKFSEPIEIAD